MNLLWLGLITIFVLVEKVVPYGDVCGRWSAVPLIIAGLITLVFDIRIHEHLM